MEIACTLETTASWHYPRVVAAGFFDGVHRGHQELLRRTVTRAQELEGVSGVLTFDSHPLTILRPQAAPLMLGTMEQKLALMARVGVDYVLKLPFDEWLRQLSPEEFVEEVLVGSLSPAQVIVGFNFTFGRGASGSVHRLGKLLGARGIGMEVVHPVADDGTVISSTVIRNCLDQGDVQRAASLLGRPYQLCGRVQAGAGRGRSLGFPTCNMVVPDRVMVPRRGVYAVWVTLAGGHQRLAVCNIGHRPTFGGKTRVIEVHLIDHTGNHYGEPLVVDFHHYLREEQQFACGEQLGRQIACDIQRTRDYFSGFACSSRV